MSRIALGVTLLAAIACADAATLRLSHPYGELIDRGVVTAAIQASSPDRVDCGIASAVAIAERTVTITVRRLDRNAPYGTCPSEVMVPIGELARGAWRVELRVLDTFGAGLVEGAFVEVRVHAPESTCGRYPMSRAVVEVRHRVLDGLGLRDRIARDAVFAARIGNPFDVMLLLALDPTVAMLRYDWLDNPHDKRALLERTGEFDRLYAYDGGACLATPPPDLFGSMIEYHHADLDHYFYTANPSEIAGLDDGTGARGWTRTGRSFRVLRSPGCPYVRHEQAAYRFFGKPGVGPSSHVFTVDREECRIVADSGAWLYESVAFWATPPDSSGGCSHPGEIPLYRVWKSFGDSNHRFTTERAVVEEMKAKGWVDEGIAMCVRAS
jgi:hypothetical protein